MGEAFPFTEKNYFKKEVAELTRSTHYAICESGELIQIHARGYVKFNNNTS